MCCVTGQVLCDSRQSERRVFFEDVIGSRRRDRSSWNNTGVAKVVDCLM